MSGVDAPDMGHGSNRAWRTAREVAEDHVSRMLADHDGIAAQCIDDAAEIAVDVTLTTLIEPDRDMISAGVAAFELAMQRSRPIEQRDLVAVIWRAMLDEARR